MSFSDKESRLFSLMQAVQSGDRVAYEELIVSVVSILKPYFFKKLSDKYMIDDLIQDTLIGIHRSRQTFQSTQPFLPWMFSIAYRKYCDYCRKVTREQSGQASYGRELYVFQQGSELDERIELADFMGDVQDVLPLLPEKQRRVVVMMKLEGKSIKEVSSLLGMSGSAVRTAAHRGYKRLSELLTERGRLGCNFLLLFTNISIGSTLLYWLCVGEIVDV